jgi:hypothetical protein
VANYLIGLLQFQVIDRDTLWSFNQKDTKSEITKCVEQLNKAYDFALKISHSRLLRDICLLLSELHINSSMSDAFYYLSKILLFFQTNTNAMFR